MSKSHVEIRITQNGKTRNYVTRVTEALLQQDISVDTPPDIRVTLSAIGRCVNKLVTVIEVSKTLIPHELHQYTTITAVERNSQDTDFTESYAEGHAVKPPPLKSQLCITLSTRKLVDDDATNSSYQHHFTASGQNPTRPQLSLLSSSARCSDNNRHDRAIDARGTRVRKSRRVKKKDIEDAKNVLF